MKKTISLLVSAGLTLAPLCSITASAEDSSYSFNISFVSEDTGEYVADVNAKLLQRAIEWQDDEHYTFVGDPRVISEWNTSNSNPYITQNITDDWHDYIYSVVADELPADYSFNGSNNVENGISGCLDGEVKVTIKLKEGELEENITPLNGTYSLRLSIMDIVRNEKVAGLDCELFNLQTGDVVASWNTSETEELFVENLAYSFDSPDSYGNTTYAIRIKNLPENYRFFYGKNRDKYGVCGFGIEEFANGNELSNVVYLEDTSEDAPKYEYVTTAADIAPTETTTTTAAANVDEALPQTGTSGMNKVIVGMAAAMAIAGAALIAKSKNEAE